MLSGAFLFCRLLGFIGRNVGACFIPYTLLGVPYFNYFSFPQSPILSIKAPTLLCAVTGPGKIHPADLRPPRLGLSEVGPAPPPPPGTLNPQPSEPKLPCYAGFP